MKSDVTLLAVLCSLLFVGIVFAVPSSKERSRLVLSPATCASLIPLGLSLPSVPGGCLYIGPVRRDFYSVGLGDLWVPRSAVLAETDSPEGNPQ